MHRQLYWRPVAVAVVILIGCTLVFVRNYLWPMYLDQAASRGQSTLRLSVASMLGAVQRYEMLPELFAEDGLIKQLVQDPENIYLIEQANRSLKYSNALLGSADIYLLTPDGITVAASNFDSDVSFIGENFGFRPYFRTALNGGRGSYFALGATSAKRGYYFSSPVRIGNAIKGVIVFKVNIEAIESAWGGGEQEIVVTDKDNIIFMSSNPDWLFTALVPLPPDRADIIRRSRQYAEMTIEKLPVVERGLFGETELLSIGQNGRQVQQYLDLAEEMPQVHWVVHVLFNTRAAYVQTVLTAIMLFLAEALVVAAIVVSLNRRSRLAEHLAQQEEAQRELEHRVEERTADLNAAKAVLEKEVLERQATERVLRRTQSDLVQAGKLAALGQMSAALSHELSQPLTAIRTYADSAQVLLEMNREEEARSNISRIVAMADRMTEIGRHLRNFARKPGSKRSAVELAIAMGDAIEIVEPRLKEADVTLDIDVPPGLVVEAGLVRLTQVFVNILGNAADAVEGRAERQIIVTAGHGDHFITLSFRDTGPGVAADRLKRIFDPFYTTKGVGAGMGLGLSISYNIIKDFGGELSVENHKQGGAVFTVALPPGGVQRRVDRLREAVVQ